MTAHQEFHKRTANDTPILSWCIIARNCETTIENTLKSLRERTPEAEIVVVDTCSSDSTPEIARRYADVFEEYRGPRGDWDREMPDFDDAASARQRSFELASGRWRAWVDSDDVIPGPEETQRLLELNAMWKPEDQNAEVIDTTDKVMTLEEMLVEMEENHPEVTVIKAPYLYQRDEHDRSLLWQTRERIVRWSDNWKWMEKAHEILCPIDGNFGRRADFTSLLFLHEKDWTEAATKKAVDRHFKVLINEEPTTRRCLYLAAYAKVLCPEREAEFIDAAHRSAGNKLDRYRAKVAEAEYYIARGLYTDSREALGAATDLVPHIPDAWIVGANAAIAAEDWTRARTWLETALGCQVTMESMITPRQLQIWFPVLLATVYEKICSISLRNNDIDGAQDLYEKAEALLTGVLKNPAVGPDRERAATLYRKIRNARIGNEIARDIAMQADYLANNDEPAKVLDLLRAAPHTIEDHPVIVELEQWSKRLVTHLNDDAAYKRFYLESEEVGLQVPSPEYLIATDSPTSREYTARAYWAAEIINRKCPNGRILDLGCYDGLSAIPMLELCPGVSYVGIDLNEAAAERLRERFKARGMSDRTKVLVNKDARDDDFIFDLAKDIGLFDLAMWFEVIEHVPDPGRYLFALLSVLKPEGELLISTPWGAFDDGLPAQLGTPRDERGHVRAMTARNFYDEAQEWGRVRQLYRHAMSNNSGADTLHAAIRRRAVMTLPERPVVFAVAAALWDWNSTTVHRGGFGASEETICYLGEELAKTREVNVYGPVPEEEVQNGVGYWPQVQLRKIDPDSTLIVSRAPSWNVDELVGVETDKILWLQDATYPDLNPEVAARYRKIVCVGEWQKGIMHAAHGVPLEQLEVIGNFLLPEHFVVADPPAREPHHFIYASSPDRGLINLLRLWPRVLEMWPDATLDIFYGWRGMNKLGSGVNGNDAWVARHERARREYETLRWQKGVSERGMVSHAQIAREFMRASAWAYPTEFTETFCSNAVKSRAAGCVPVTTGLAALNETARCEQSVVIDIGEDGSLPKDYDEQWLAGLRQAVETSDADRKAMSEEAIAQYQISVMAAKWRALLLP